jgi:hypothetical protein
MKFHWAKLAKDQDGQAHAVYIDCVTKPFPQGGSFYIDGLEVATFESDDTGSSCEFRYKDFHFLKRFNHCPASYIAQWVAEQYMLFPRPKPTDAVMGGLEVKPAKYDAVLGGASR